MELFALILVFVGSVFHLMWNVLTKKAEDKLAFLWMAIIPASLITFVYSLINYTIPSDAIPYVIATILIHAFYFWALTSAYKYGDLSLVYPYGRGIGALVASLGGIFLFGERPNLFGGIGISLTLLGTFVEPLSLRGKVKQSIKGVWFTILSGITIATYLMVDKIGIKKMPTPYYLSLMLLGAALVLAPIMIKDRRFLKELSLSYSRPLMGSFFLFTAYGLILFAMERAPLSYVVAVRTTGIVLSGLAGIFFFKERLTPIRWVAILIICSGVFFTGLA